MKKPYHKESIEYRSDEVSTPYLKAKQEWDDRIGQSREQAKNWRFVALLSLLMSLLLLILLAFTITMRKEVVYVAQVTDSGKVVNISPLQVKYQPTKAQEEYFISHFVKLIRSVPLDPVVAKQNWLNAYHFLTQRGADQLNTYLRNNNPLSLLGEKTVTTDITDINPVSDNTFQIDWTETTVDNSGQEEGKNNYSGVFTILVKQPTSQAEILKNPLGIYIVDFNISSREGAK